MPVVVAVWPNNTLSVLVMPRGFSATDLFEELDQEGCPTDATVRILKTDSRGVCHIGWDFILDEGCPVGTESKGLRLDAFSGQAKKWKWPETVVRDYYRRTERNRRMADACRDIATMTADELKMFPAAPVPAFTVDEVRAMEPFCGVYFAFNEDGTCHYVGESTNVTARVSKSRAEIGSRTIGVLKCERHERKRIEAYFIGILDPPGNSQSTASQKMIENQRNSGGTDGR